MSELFRVEVNTINYNLKEIFDSKELEQNQTIRKIRTVQKEGNRNVSRELTFYSLDAIIAVGYSINEFLEFRRYDILKDNCKISRKKAEEKTEKEYKEFNKTQKINSDFDKLLLESKKLENKI